MKLKDPQNSSKDSKALFSSPGVSDSGSAHPRQRRHQDHEKQRKELLAKPPAQSMEKRGESLETETHPEGSVDQIDSPTKQTRTCVEGGSLSGAIEQPFIKLSQEEYSEHHSSIMHCRVDCSGRRVASLDVDGVIKLLLGSGVGTVRLYDTEAKKNLYEMMIDDVHPRILSLACSPSGTSFVCSAAAHNLRSGTLSESGARGSSAVPGQLLLWDTKTVKQQVFALQAEQSRLPKEEVMVHHKLPPYVQNMDRLGDTELDLISSQRSANLTAQPQSGSFLSSLESVPFAHGRFCGVPAGSSPTQASVTMGRRDAAASHSMKLKDPQNSSKDSKALFSSTGVSDSGSAHPRQRRHQDHEKQRKELLAKPPAQFSEFEETMGSTVERTDELVREYLIFRGFTSSLRHLDVEIKADKEKGFRVDKIIEQLQQFIQSYDLPGLRDYWGYLDRRLFSRLEDIYRPTVNKLRTSLYRYYLVYTVQTARSEKTQEFFQKQAQELQGQTEWRDWFVLPFIPSPELNSIFAPYFSRHLPLPVLLSFDAEVQRSAAILEENELLRQTVFALQAEQSRLPKEEVMVHHKLPPYVQNMDRLGDTELDLISSQRSANLTAQPQSSSFLSSLLSQGKRVPAKTPQGAGSSSTQASVTMGRRDAAASHSMKLKDPQNSSKDSKALFSSTGVSDSGSAHPRQRRHQDHEKQRKELLAKPPAQSMEKRGESLETETHPEGSVDQIDSPTKQTRTCVEGGSLSGAIEQPFIKLSQEEYSEHHSSIMHCRVDCSGRRVASLDVDGVIKVWSFNPLMQTKATIMSKSPLLSLEWATKPDRLLLLGSGVGTVRLYDTEAKKNLYEMMIDDVHPRILSLACSPSGTSFVCSAAAHSLRSGTLSESGARGSSAVPGQLLLWDTKTVKQQLQFSLEPGPIAINCTAFNHNGNLLVTGAADGIIRLFVHYIGAVVVANSNLP
ncbi:WD repeat-containing protein 91 [Acipenser ruthenus]|uniref:WD repeat-containing protein 91 n=1 Tax=Acipenser ruthenus TaxID=7906 RepID=A0A444V220_ACIRT|nr:WD repeat-containing protein 91 [Acipenser ruthenus]